MHTPTLRISEIFYSIQGESSFVGLPTVFIRLTGCPLRCQYCDTSYAFSGGQLLTIQQILQETAQYNSKIVTVTGGEPLAQDNCSALLDALVAEGYTVTLETSGALDIATLNPAVIRIMDLKTPASGEESRNRYQNIDSLRPQDEVKFVICDTDDYEWSKQLVETHQLDQRCTILFSPSSEQYSAVELADKILADELPVRFQMQLHKILWNDAQGH